MKNHITRESNKDFIQFSIYKKETERYSQLKHYTISRLNMGLLPSQFGICCFVTFFFLLLLHIKNSN